MVKPVYKHPPFVTDIDALIKENENKRLYLTLTIDEKKKDNSIAVILKNPSRATKEISDKTVFNVTNYIYKNKDKYSQFSDIGKIVILNLIPYYETYSNLLANSKFAIIDKENLEAIKIKTKECKNVIIAWGDHPKGLLEKYEIIRKSVLEILKENKSNIYYVGKLSKKSNPKHGQVWGYNDELLKFNI